MLCPRCDEKLLLVGYPREAETERVVSMGNRKALRDPVPTPATRLQERFENERLKAANQLPDLEGDALAYACYYEDRDRDGLTVVGVGDRVVWSEPALWKDGHASTRSRRS